MRAYGARVNPSDQQNVDPSQSNAWEESVFLATMSHELRSPMTTILGFSQLLKEGAVGELLPRQRDYVDEIFQAGTRLMSLLNDMLELSKIESGRMPLQLDRVEIEPLIVEALSEVSYQAEVKELNLSFWCDPDIHNLPADRRKLRKMIVHYLSNAIKFTPPRGQIRVLVGRWEESVEFSVIDNGKGIAAEDLPRLFQHISQLDTKVTRKFEGAGLGLVLVRRLADLHDGTVGVSSKLGEGSRFWIRLPKIQKERPQLPLLDVKVVLTKPASREEFMEAVEYMLQDTPSIPNILLVDDDPRVLKLVTSYFSGMVEVRCAHHGAEALEKIQEKRPDLVVLDLMMPEVSGFEVLARLRNLPQTRQLPVVVMTARDLTVADRKILADKLNGVFSNATDPKVEDQIREILLAER